MKQSKNKKVASKVEPITAPVAVKPAPSQSFIIWAALKDKSINVFGMDQKVSDYCQMVDIDPSKCYLTSKATAIITTLEDNFGDKYTFSQADKYIVVEKK